jgi:hypothetical protein
MTEIREHVKPTLKAVVTKDAPRVDSDALDSQKLSKKVTETGRSKG